MKPAFVNKLYELLSIRQKRCGMTKEQMESVINETPNRIMPNSCSEEEHKTIKRTQKLC